MKESDIEKLSYKWELTEIYASESDWRQDIQRVRELSQQLISLQGRLADHPELIETAILLQDEICVILDRLYIYSKLKYDINHHNTQAKELSSLASSVSREIFSDIAFLIEELKEIGCSHLIDLTEVQPELKKYIRFFEEIERFEPHFLGSNEEGIISELNQLSSSTYNTYSILRDLETEFPPLPGENGSEIAVSESNYLILMENSNREIRQQAYHSVMGTLYKNKDTYANLLVTYALQQSINSKFHRYSSTLEAALFEENIREETYHHLIQAVRSNVHLLHSYIDIRKELLCVEKLAPYDMFVPLFDMDQIQFTIEAAIRIVNSALSPLGAEYTQQVEELLGSNRIDYLPDSNKNSGAYTWNIYDVDPYILMNYYENTDSVFGIIHELGHAVHYQFTNRNQPYLYSDCSIFITEIVSNVNECLLIDYLINHASSADEKQYYLEYFIEMFRSTVYRQSLLSEFEHFIYEQLDHNESLNSEKLCWKFRLLNQAYYGEGMQYDSLQDAEWIRISHLYKNFYTFKYPTGFLIAIHIFQKIEVHGEAFVNQYVAMLKKGNSEPPSVLLRGIGIDLSDSSIFDEGFRIFNKLIRKLGEITYGEKIGFNQN